MSNNNLCPASLHGEAPHVVQARTEAAWDEAVMSDDIRRRVRNLPVSMQLLRQVLKLPDDVEIVHAYVESSQLDVVKLRIQSQTFAPVGKGDVIPITNAQYRQERLPCCGSDNVIFERFG